MQNESDSGVSPENLSPEVIRIEAGVYSGLAENWDRFVGKEGKENRKNFLVGILKEHEGKKIFDAGLGSGGDSISLSKEGFSVASNEIDGDLAERARQNATREGVELDISSMDWRNLEQIEDGSFDSVILLGNSLTHLFDKEDQLKALSEFHRILREGGVLIIDERNYQDILDRREEIASDPLNNFQPRHKNESGRATYNEEGVRAIPTEISDNRIKISYLDSDSNQWIQGFLDLYPFKRGELQGLLQETGFSKIDQFSDFQEGFDPQADFYEYVAVK